MRTLGNLLRKKSKLIIGLMSGTSADGIDAVLLRVAGSGVRARFSQLAFTTHAYPKGFRKLLMTNSDATSARLDSVARMNILAGELFADAARKVTRLARRKLSDIDLIGSHGQTIGHFPKRVRMFGKHVGATVQIGDPAVIAKRTGIVTVGDFRVADIAVGGAGAPLVPYVDYLLFRSNTKNRAMLNIGGIANITVLGKGCSVHEVIAFDTGPGNMVVDALMKRLYGRAYDVRGGTALNGDILPAVLRQLVRHPYLKVRPPKSTGRETFGEHFVEWMIRTAGRSAKRDIVTTASAFTPIAVYDAYVRYIRPHVRIDELFVSGGGAQNSYMMELLRRLFGGVRVETVESLKMTADAKEAICFALLANEAIAGNPGNVPGATGAKHGTVLGKICL